MDAMAGVLVVLFGVLTGSLMSVLVGLVGSGRRIGFGWTFLISLIFTPFVGLIAALLSEPLPGGGKRWGCLSVLLGILSVIFFVVFLLLLFAGGLLAGAAF